ncbi:MAG: CvpA family protein [Bacillota bacterium]
MNILNILDLTLIIFFLLFIINGYKKGFIEQVSVILGLVIAFYLAINFYHEARSLIVPYFDLPKTLLDFIAFALIFIIFNILIHILAEGLKSLFDLLYLKPLNRLAGAFLGFIKGALILYLLVLFLKQIPYSEIQLMIDDSLISNYFLDLTPIIQESLNDFFKKP